MCPSDKSDWSDWSDIPPAHSIGIAQCALARQ